MDLMETRLRQHPQYWSNDYIPERKIDCPVLPPVSRPVGWNKKHRTRRDRQNVVQGFEMISPNRATKLENDQKCWLTSLPWSYAEAVKKPNNKQSNQAVTKEEDPAEGSSESSDQENISRETAEINDDHNTNGEITDGDSPLNPDASEFVPGATSSEKDEMTASVTISTTDDDNNEDINEQNNIELIDENETKQSETIITADEKECSKSEKLNEINGNIHSENGKVHFEHEEEIEHENKENSLFLIGQTVISNSSEDNLVYFEQDQLNQSQNKCDPFEPITTNNKHDTVDQNPKAEFEVIDNFVTSSSFEEFNCKNKEENNETVNDKIISFGSELNFEELVKNKTNYSETHFDNDDSELNTSSLSNSFEEQKHNQIEFNDEKDNRNHIENHDTNEDCSSSENYQNSDELNDTNESSDNKENKNVEFEFTKSEVKSCVHDSEPIQSEEMVESNARVEELSFNEHLSNKVSEETSYVGTDVQANSFDNPMDDQMPYESEDNGVENDGAERSIENEVEDRINLNENFFSKEIEKEANYDENIKELSNEITEGKQSEEIKSDMSETISEIISSKINDIIIEKTDLYQTELKEDTDTAQDKGDVGSEEYSATPQLNEIKNILEDIMTTSMYESQDNDSSFEIIYEPSEFNENDDQVQKSAFEESHSEKIPEVVEDLKNENSLSDHHSDLFEELGHKNISEAYEFELPKEGGVHVEKVLNLEASETNLTENLTNDNTHKYDQHTSVDEISQENSSASYTLDLNEEDSLIIESTPSEEFTEDKGSKEVEQIPCGKEPQSDFSKSIEEDSCENNTKVPTTLKMQSQADLIQSDEEVSCENNSNAPSILEMQLQADLIQSDEEVSCENNTNVPTTLEMQSQADLIQSDEEVSCENNSNAPSILEMQLQADSIQSDEEVSCKNNTNVPSILEMQPQADLSQSVEEISCENITNSYSVLETHLDESHSREVISSEATTDIKEVEQIYREKTTQCLNEDSVFVKDEICEIEKESESQIVKGTLAEDSLQAEIPQIDESQTLEDISLGKLPVEDDQLKPIEEESNEVKSEIIKSLETDESQITKEITSEDLFEAKESQIIEEKIVEKTSEVSQTVKEMINELHTIEICEAQEIEEETQFNEEVTQGKKSDIDESLINENPFLEKENKIQPIEELTQKQMNDNFKDQITKEVHTEKSLKVDEPILNEDISEERPLEDLKKELSENTEMKETELTNIVSLQETTPDFQSTQVEEVAGVEGDAKPTELQRDLNERIIDKDILQKEVCVPVSDEASKDSHNISNFDVTATALSAAAITSVAIGAAVAAETLVSKKTKMVPENKEAHEISSKLVESIKPLNESINSAMTPTESPVKPSSTVLEKPKTPTTSKSPAAVKSNVANKTPGKPSTPTAKSSASPAKAAGAKTTAAAKPSASGKPAAAAKPVAGAKPAGGGVKPAATKSNAATKTVAAAAKPSAATKPAAAAAATKPVASAKAVAAAKPSTTAKPVAAAAAKTAVGATKPAPPPGATKPATAVAKPATPTKPASASTASPKPGAKPTAAKSAAATPTKAAPSKPGTPTAKPGTPTTKSPLGAKPAASKPVSTASKPGTSTKPGTLSAKAAPTDKSAAAKSAAPKPSTPTAKASPAKPPSATPTAAQPVKKPGTPTKQSSVTSTVSRPSSSASEKSPAGKVNGSSHTKPSATNTTPKAGTPAKAPGKGSEAAADKSKSASNKSPAKSQTPVKKSSAAANKDKNAKILTKSATKDKEAPVKNDLEADIKEEDEPVTSTTTGDLPLENGSPIELPPQIIV